jgi:hypothetical protein
MRLIRDELQGFWVSGFGLLAGLGFMLGLGFQVLAGVGFMLGFGFQAWLLGLKPMGFGFRPPPVKPMQGAKKRIKKNP